MSDLVSDSLGKVILALMIWWFWCTDLSTVLSWDIEEFSVYTLRLREFVGFTIKLAPMPDALGPLPTLILVLPLAGPY